MRELLYRALAAGGGGAGGALVAAVTEAPTATTALLGAVLVLGLRLDARVSALETHRVADRVSERLAALEKEVGQHGRDAH